MNLSLIALGLALAQRQNKLAGWFPFMAFIFYSGGNALVRSSGWRFSLPVDWTILAYYCIALAYLPGKMGAVLQPGKPSTPPPADTRQRSFLLSIIFALLFLAGASVPIAERLIPNRDFETFDVEARSSMFQTQIVSPTELGAFLQQKDAVFVSGIALYPRYYRPDSHIYLADMPTDFSYLHLLLLSRGHEQVVLPLKNVPGAIPNASPVSVLGCRAEGYISAWAVLVHSQPEQILIRDPRNSLHCPLAESN
jgi:hypothetical protein